MMRQAKKRVAVIDGFGDSATVGLYLEYDNGDTQELDWPDTWPSVVNALFLQQQGYEVITA